MSLCEDGLSLNEVEMDKSIVVKQSMIPIGGKVNDNTSANKNSEMLSDNGSIINHESDQVKASDHSKTYAQVAALQPTPKKTQLINETFVKNTLKTTQQSNDIGDEFKGIQNKRYRTKKLFLSGIAEDVKETNILAYLMKRNIKPTYISVFKSRRKGCRSAKINIPSSASKLIESENFWPKYVKCKPWRSNREKYSTYV